MTIEQKPVWHCAVKNTTTSKDKWYYHLFYDFDDMNLESSTIKWIVDFMRAREMSFIFRKSVHGYHLIGLTPIDAYKWGLCFNMLQDAFPTYHDGQALRITKKEAGEFTIIAENYDYPFVGNLVRLFKKDFKPNNVIDGAGNGGMIREQWYVLLYYTTNKKNVKNKEVVGLHKGVNVKR